MDKEDKRYQKAEERIKKTFLSLLEEKGFQSVSVTDIIKQAGINRTTFYAHYKDKYELVEQLELELWKPLFTMLEEKLNPPGDLLNNMQGWLLHIANYYYEHRNLLLLYAGDRGDPNYWNFFSRKIQELLNQTTVKSQLAVPLEYMMAFLMGASSSVLMIWVKRGFRETPEEFSKIIYEIAKDIPKDVLIVEGRNADVSD